MFREFFADIRNQKLRTTLTVLGIAWGTVAVVVLLAFGVGLERQTKKRFHGLGDRIVVLFGGRTTKPFAGLSAMGAASSSPRPTRRCCGRRWPRSRRSRRSTSRAAPRCAGA